MIKQGKKNRITHKKNLLRNLSKVYYAFSIIHLKPIQWIGRLIGMGDLGCNLLMPYAEAIESSSDCYMTYKLMPKEAGLMNPYLPYVSTKDKDCCIVMQGPLCLKNHFTLETIKLYNKIFPGITVILSTWHGEDADEISRIIKETKCEVVQNKLLDNRGAGNSNLQAFSSLAGAKRAEQLGKKYILKVRTDSRVMARGIFSYLVDLINKYPVQENSCLSDRIIVFNAFLFQPYHSSDFFFFGNTKDMVLLFDKKENDYKISSNYADKMIENKMTYRQSFANPFGEIELLIRLFEKMKGNASCDLKEWWEVLSEYLIALPQSCLQSVWYKYDYNHEESNYNMLYRRRILGGTGIDNTVVDYSMWVDMVNKEFLVNCDDYSYLLDEQMS